MATSEDPSEVWYEGNCHCAAIKYKVKLPPLDSQQIMSCNCSICCKNGYLNAYPKKADLIFVQGEDLLKEYQFGLKRCAHKFCPNCGSSVLIDPIPGNPDILALNVCSLSVFHL